MAEQIRTVPQPRILLLLLLLYGHKVEAARKPESIECLRDTDCGVNAFCHDLGYCDCQPGFYKNSYGIPLDCVPVSTVFGSACTFPKQCQITWGTWADCRDEGRGNQCLCRPDAHLVPEENQCFQNRRVGQSCDFNQNCVTKGDIRAICERGYCSCPYKYREVDNGTLCIPSLPLGSKCSRDEECAGWGSHARCLQICRCRMGYVISSNNGTCLQAANALDEPCIEDAQCSEYVRHSSCNKGKCDCAKSYHRPPGNTRCWPRRELEEDCSFTEECVLASGNFDRIICDLQTKICQCKSGYQATRDFGDCTKTNGGIFLQPGNIIIYSLLFINLFIIYIL